MSDAGRERAINLARWDELAALHGDDAYYDSTALIAGADSLAPEESALVGEVAGLDVIHIQCHIGFDSISLARRAARVTGVDFSPAALAKAQALAERCGESVDWVEGDAMALPGALTGRFDLAYATVGVLCWIPRLEEWMRSAFRVLRPGGRLVLLDGHPLAMMVASRAPFVVDFPYGGGAAHHYAFDRSYTGAESVLRNAAGVNWAHSLGEIVTACAQAGLRVDALTEYLESSFRHAGLGDTPPEPDGRYRLRVPGGEPLPLLFSLEATRPV